MNLNCSQFYSQIKQDSMVYSNILFVLEKVEAENHLSNLTSTVKNIIDKEVFFANAKLAKIQLIHQENFDFNLQLIQNTMIFKENLKLITSSLSLLNSRLDLDEFTQKRMS